MKQKLMLITGVSSGLGQALALEALHQGHRVVGTLRDPAACAAFSLQQPGRSHGVMLDVTDEAATTRVVDEVESTYGAIDVLVNNAGYGHEGTIEESPLHELRRQFDVNVFGVVAMIRAVLPYMRRRRSGHIVNITSMGGLITMPGIAYYNGSKFALEGISGALGKEVKSFGIHVTAVEPGMFRTDWAGRSMVRSARSIEDYDAVFEPLRAARLSRNGQQPGDPVKAARAMLTMLESPTPPTHLLLGPDALRYVATGRAEFDAETVAWRELSESTDISL